MNFDSAPRKEQGPDQERVKSFKVPIARFIEGDAGVVKILRESVQRDNMGNPRKSEREAWLAAVTQVRKELSERYKPVVGQQIGGKADKGLAEKLDRLDKLEEELAFAA